MSNKNSRNKVSDTALTVAIRLLEAINISSDVLPQLKSVSGGVLHLTKLIQGFREMGGKWDEFLNHVQISVALIAQSAANHASAPRPSIVSTPNYIDSLEDLNKLLQKMQNTIMDLQQARRTKRFLTYLKDPEVITAMEKDLERVLARLHLEKELQIGQDVRRTVKDLQDFRTSLENMTKEIATARTTISAIQGSVARVESAVNTAIDPVLKKGYAEGASWDFRKTCQEGTRKQILTQIMDWIGSYRANDTAKILCLTGAPGSGKTTIAHSIAKMCSVAGWLATAFFFSREAPGRSALVFNTLACDLAARFPVFKELLSNAIDQDPSLASSSSSSHEHQLMRLVLPFCKHLPSNKPIVIVLDALDEGYSEDLLQTLMQVVTSLPGTFRFVVTSRDVTGTKQLLAASHVRHIPFHHNEAVYVEDVKAVIQFELDKVAKAKQSFGRPTAELECQMQKRSGGLMIWVIAVCQYLMHQKTYNPWNKLQNLLQDQGKIDSGEPLAEEKMNLLYKGILEQYDWDDKDFVGDYQQIIGTILALKIPLTAQAIHKLRFSKLNVLKFLSHARPLFLPSDEGQPVQILHQSLYDFLVDASQLADTSKMYTIDAKHHQQNIALQCINIMNTELSETTPGTGYIGKQRGLPKFPDDSIPEHLRYACRFWLEHLKDITNPWAELIFALQVFMEHKFKLWIEVSASKWQQINIEYLIQWTTEYSDSLQRQIHAPYIAEAFTLLSWHLKEDGYLNESLIAAQLGLRFTKFNNHGNDVAYKAALAQAISALSSSQAVMGMRQTALYSCKECVCMRRKLVQKNPRAFNADLAWDLGNLSMRLAEMGHREQALQAIEECVSMRRKLVQKNPRAFNADLAWDLRNFSIRLVEMGHRERALQAIEECVSMRRKLVQKNPRVFNADLAWDLGNLSICLAEMGHREQALTAIQECVCMWRKLVQENPKAFNANLAHSLGNLSNRLAKMGHREQALQTIEECVSMERRLVQENPKAFNADLAHSLENCSNCLAGMGHREQALQAIEECVSIWRKLAQENPKAFNADLARGLGNLSNRLAEMGHREQALRAIEECVSMRRRLVQENPKAFNADLAHELGNLSNRLAEMGHREQALRAIEECVSMRRRLVQENPKAFNADLAWSLYQFANMLINVGNRDAALQVIREAVEMFRKLKQKQHNAFYQGAAEAEQLFADLQMHG